MESTLVSSSSTWISVRQSILGNCKLVQLAQQQKWLCSPVQMQILRLAVPMCTWLQKQGTQYTPQEESSLWQLLQATGTVEPSWWVWRQFSNLLYPAAYQSSLSNPKCTEDGHIEKFKQHKLLRPARSSRPDHSPHLHGRIAIGLQRFI